MRDIHWFDDDEDEPVEGNPPEVEPFVLPLLKRPRSRFGKLFAAYMVIFGTAVAACVIDPIDIAPGGVGSSIRLLLTLLATPFLLWFLKTLVVDIWVQSCQFVRSLRESRAGRIRRPGVWDPWMDDNGWTGGTFHEH